MFFLQHEQKCKESLEYQKNFRNYITKIPINFVLNYLNTAYTFIRII